MSATPETKEENETPGGSSPTTIFFDPQGDTRLLVKVDEVDRVFVVCAKVMCLVCDAWKCMLSPDGFFKEAQPAADGMKEVDLPEDDGRALAILLNIAHLRFEEIPETLTFADLLGLSVLTDKYGATRLVKPWVKKWIDALGSTINKDGYEEWLWIAWEFGETEIFEKVCAHLVKSATKVEFCDPKTGKNPHHSIFNTSLYNFPPESIESIMAVRAKTIDDLLQVYFGCLEKYRNACREQPPTTMCKSFEHKAQCDSLMYGAITMHLIKIGLGETKETAETDTWSVTALSWALKLIALPTYPFGGRDPTRLSYNGGSDLHTKCNYQKQLENYIQVVLDKIPSAVLDHHRVHMERQRAILRYDTDSKHNPETNWI